MKRAATIVFLLATASVARADAFDDYDSVHLKNAAASNHAEKKDRLSREELVAANQILPKVDGVFLIVHTNDNRWAKLLVHPAAQKIDKETTAPILLIERFVTFKEGEERQRVAEGKNVRLFPDFHMNLDFGAIVPDKGIAADLRFVRTKEGAYVEPLGKAELFLVTKHLAEATPAKGAKVVVGPKFAKELFAGKYLVYDDGKPPSELTLAVGPKGDVTGWMFSGTTGAKYEVFGTVGPNPPHGIQFTVALPRTHQTFTGWMFVGDAAAIAGFSRLEGRETGFYAVRQP